MYEILLTDRKEKRKKKLLLWCHIEVRSLANGSRAGLQRRGEVQSQWLQHVSPLAWSRGWKNDIITDDPYSYR